MRRYRIIFDHNTHEPAYVFAINTCRYVKAWGYTNGIPSREFIMPNPITQMAKRKYFFHSHILGFILLFLSLSANAQLITTGHSVAIYCDSLSVQKSFSILRRITPASLWFYDLYVIHKGVTYYRPKVTFIRKTKAIIIDGMNSRKVRI